MKISKAKVIAMVGGLGGLCALCCTLPVMAFLGFGVLESFFCENEVLQFIASGIAIGSAAYLFRRWLIARRRGVSSCATDCGCKAAI